MVYDFVGDLRFHTDFNGETTEYQYDNMNRRERILHDPLDGRPDHTMSYNDSGLVTSVTDERGTTSYVYDERDRLIQMTNADGAVIDYGYDPAGNRISLSTVNQSITYGYDDLNRLETVNDGNGTTTYSYDGVGNRDQVDHANGTRTRYTYDDLNRLTQLVNEGPAPTRELISQHDYTLGDAGNRRQLDEILAQPGSPSVTRNTTYVYDDLYRLTQESVTDTAGLNKQTTWTYDTVGNRLTETRTGGANPGLTTYVYDDNDWIQSETTGSTVTTYTYDDNGNTLTKTTAGAQVATYTYDSDNRMVQANITDGGTTTATFYEYDTNGIRQQETTGGIVRSYLVDMNRAYAQVIEESNNVAGLTRMYLHGDDLLTQSRVANGNPATSTIDTYLYDGLGSARALTSSTGATTDAYTYQVFGELETQNGTTPNNYLYTGEQFDPNVGFYYLRARYYNPSIGRFQTMDTYAGRMHEPQTLHKYLYVHANPVNMIDPSGQAGVSFLTAPTAMIGTLTSASVTIFNVVTKVESVITLFQATRGIALAVNKVTSGGFMQMAQSDKDFMKVIRNLDEAMAVLAKNMGRVIGDLTRDEDKKKAIRGFVRNKDAPLLIFGPTPNSRTPWLPSGTRIKAGKIRVGKQSRNIELELGSGRGKGGRVTGLGGGHGRGKGFTQWFRMDWHPPHQDSNDWIDEPYHFHTRTVR